MGFIVAGLILVAFAIHSWHTGRTAMSGRSNNIIDREKKPERFRQAVAFHFCFGMLLIALGLYHILRG